jgi:hypothetical protein
MQKPVPVVTPVRQGMGSRLWTQGSPRFRERCASHIDGSQRLIINARWFRHPLAP